MKLRKKIKRDAVYGLTRVMFWLLNTVPRACALFLGCFFGLAAWHLLKREQHRTYRHLTLVFSERLTSDEKRIVGRAFFVNSGKNLADVIRFKKHFATELKDLVDIEGLENFDAAYRRGKGVFGVTGHIGNFELLPVYVASLGYEIAVIGRRLYDQRLDELLVGNRRSFGITNIATTDSPRVMFRWLKGGGAVGVLIDNDSSRVRSMHIPAFNRLSNTPIGQAIIAFKTGAALVPMACLRTEDNRYRIIIRPEIQIDGNLTEKNWVYQSTLMCTRELESIILSCPQQWAWHHNRWRTPVENTS